MYSLNTLKDYGFNLGKLHGLFNNLRSEGVSFIISNRIHIERTKTIQRRERPAGTGSLAAAPLLKFAGVPQTDDSDHLKSKKKITKRWRNSPRTHLGIILGRRKRGKRKLRRGSGRCWLGIGPISRKGSR